MLPLRLLIVVRIVVIRVGVCGKRAVSLLGIGRSGGG